MNTKKLSRIVIILVVIVTLWWALSSPNEEQLVRKRILELTELAKQEPNEHPVTRTVVSKKICDYFLDTLIVEFPTGEFETFEIKSSQELNNKVLMARSKLDALEVDVKLKSIHAKSDKANAEIELSVLGSLINVDGQFLEIHRGELHFIKQDDTWKIERVVHLRNLREPNQ